MTEKEKLIGTAIRHPFRINELGRVEIASGDDVIRQSLRDILLTAKGSRFDNPGYGSGIYELMFEQNDTILESLLEYQIRIAIQKWEKRVIYQQSSFTVDENNPDVINCRVEVLNKIDNKDVILTFPFYRNALT